MEWYRLRNFDRLTWWCSVPPPRIQTRTHTSVFKFLLNSSNIKVVVCECFHFLWTWCLPDDVDNRKSRSLNHQGFSMMIDDKHDATTSMFYTTLWISVPLKRILIAGSRKLSTRASRCVDCPSSLTCESTTELSQRDNVLMYLRTLVISGRVQKGFT